MVEKPQQDGEAEPQIADNVPVVEDARAMAEVMFDSAVVAQTAVGPSSSRGRGDTSNNASNMQGSDQMIMDSCGEEASIQFLQFLHQ